MVSSIPTEHHILRNITVPNKRNRFIIILVKHAIWLINTHAGSDDTFSSIVGFVKDFKPLFLLSNFTTIAKCFSRAGFCAYEFELGFFRFPKLLQNPRCVNNANLYYHCKFGRKNFYLISSDQRQLSGFNKVLYHAIF